MKQAEKAIMNDAVRERIERNFEALLRKEMAQVDLKRVTPKELEAITSRIRRHVEADVKLELVAAQVGDNG